MLRLSRGFKPRQLLRAGSDDVPDRSEMQAKEACAEAAGVIFVVVVIVGARAKPARMMMT